jgi:hypothetical protein
MDGLITLDDIVAVGRAEAEADGWRDRGADAHPCPRCKVGTNSPGDGGNARCFHCSECGYVACAEVADNALAPVSTAGWQPIETAPKDERHILAIGRADGKWTSITQIAWNPWLDAWADHPAPNEVAQSHGVALARIVKHAPTHWMPLPSDPPAEKEQ